ncbi:MAG: methyltransferase domain-containing protein [Bacteroidetes bacterium]|nr:methyltransferase domain-containing protein [Bacteroidota bacterium]
MGLKDISADRSLLSYAKVQKAISSVIRGHRPFFNSKRIAPLKHLNVGCGLHPEPALVNLDYHWVPGVDVCWDLTRPHLPFPDARFDGIFTEHCIDGLPHRYFMPVLRDLHRVLKPGGTLRMSTTDGGLYCDLYQQRKTDPAVRIPYAEELGETTAMMSLNRVMRHICHTFVFDEGTLALRLREAGFREVRRCAYHEGRDPALLVDRPERRSESLYMEAVR